TQKGSRPTGTSMSFVSLSPPLLTLKAVTELASTLTLNRSDPDRLRAILVDRVESLESADTDAGIAANPKVVRQTSGAKERNIDVMLWE
ncbi:MAG: hypothetical protein ACREVB_00250, partial [Burkholderiales bacterium]